jgi:hypothetical protein
MQEKNGTKDNFTQILPLPKTIEAPLTSSHISGMAPFKAQVNFDIPLFKV